MLGYMLGYVLQYLWNGLYTFQFVYRSNSFVFDEFDVSKMEDTGNYVEHIIFFCFGELNHW